MNDFDQVTFGDQAVEDLESEFPDNLSADTVNAGQPAAFGCRRMNSTAA
jgi:hypothetical protein